MFDPDANRGDLMFDPDAHLPRINRGMVYLGAPVSSRGSGSPVSDR